MSNYTAMDGEDNQYRGGSFITWPAQALSYKMGQIKILELRARAQRELGAKFDVRAFHNAVLDSGSLPLESGRMIVAARQAALAS
ncbi:MAG: DUF885 family protein [Terriglobales bacterium]